MRPPSKTIRWEQTGTTSARASRSPSPAPSSAATTCATGGHRRQTRLRGSQNRWSRSLLRSGQSGPSDAVSIAATAIEPPRFWTPASTSSSSRAVCHCAGVLAPWIHGISKQPLLRRRAELRSLSALDAVLPSIASPEPMPVTRYSVRSDNAISASFSHVLRRQRRKYWRPSRCLTNPRGSRQTFFARVPFARGPPAVRLPSPDSVWPSVLIPRKEFPCPVDPP